MRTILTGLISGVVAGVLVLVGSLGIIPKESSESVILGSATTSVSFVPTLIPIATSTTNFPNDLGTTSETSSDRRFGRAQFDWATTVSIDVYDEFKVGRTATATIENGNITAVDLTITGVCTGCAGASTADLQDIYNNSAVDAQILTTTGKDIVLFLTNTDSNATLQVLSGTNGEGQLQIGTADGTATTTTGIWAGYGALGIGTTSPGGGLAVSATSSIFGGPVYALDHLRTSYFIATSTTATSSVPSLSVSTNISAVNVLITGDLNVDTGTSTLQGATFAGLYTTNGLRVDTGDAVFDQLIKIDGTGTSTFAGTFQVNSSGTGTSTLTNLDVSSIRISGGLYPNMASTTITSGTTTITFDCSLGSKATAVIDRDVAVNIRNCYGGQSLITIIDDPGHASGDYQIDWDGIVEAWPGGEVASTTLKWDNGTSSTGYISQGASNVCSFIFATSSDNTGVWAIAECADRGYEYR